MIRAAAKNHEHVAVVVDPADYPALIEALSGKQAPEEAARLRRRLAWKAFQHTATYDSTVAEWLWTQTGADAQRILRDICDTGSAWRQQHGSSPARASPLHPV